MPDAETEVSTEIDHLTAAPEVSNELEAETHGILQAPAIAVESSAADRAACDHAVPASRPPVSNDSYLLWLAISRPQAATGSPTSMATFFALAVLIPLLNGVMVESFQPVQALAASISALIDVFNGSLAIRT